jgi:tyrosinase
MWWRWQQFDLAKRGTEYIGKAATDSSEKASLEDSMPMGGLAADIKVLEVMSTESDLLCYRY